MRSRCHDAKDDSAACKCHPTKSQLFCVTNFGATRFEGEDDELVIWQDVAHLKVCAPKCARVLHTVSGTIHAVFEDSDDTAAVADFLFRVIDEFGHVVCERRVRYAAGFPEDVGDTEVLFPFSFQCCDKVGGCDVWQHYRLQADLIDERLAENNDVWVQDVTWTAIVWEPEEKEF